MPSGSPPDPFNEGEQLIDDLAGGRQTLGVGVHCVPRQTALLGDGSVARALSFELEVPFKLQHGYGMVCHLGGFYPSNILMPHLILSGFCGNVSLPMTSPAVKSVRVWSEILREGQASLGISHQSRSGLHRHMQHEG